MATPSQQDAVPHDGAPAPEPPAAPPAPDAWYLAPTGHAEGPVPLIELRARFAGGALGGGVPVRHVQWETWRDAREVPWLADVLTGVGGEPTAASEETNASVAGASVGAAFRRASARLVDLAVVSLVSALVVQLLPGGAALAPTAVDPSAPPAAAETLPALVWVAVVGVLAESLLLRLGGGRTPGKALFALRVISDRDASPGFGLFFRRTLAAWGIGLGFGVPLLNLLLPIVQFVRVLDVGRTHYDRIVGTRVAVTPLPWWRALLGGLLVVFLLAAGIVALGAGALAG